MWSADNLFCLALVLVFIGLIAFEKIVKRGWLLKYFQRKLLTVDPSRRPGLINRWSSLTLLTRSQVEVLEKEYIVPEPEVSLPLTQPTLTRTPLEHCTGQAVITAALPLAKRMQRINELHKLIYLRTIELNEYRRRADLPPLEVEL